MASQCLEDGGNYLNAMLPVIISLAGLTKVYDLLYARYSDAFNFQVPYMVSISLSVLGGLLYAIAPAFSNNKTALASVALGRIVGGFGRANSALAFAYVARKCEAKQRTSIMTLLGGVQMIGMAIAPLFNAFLSGVDFSLLGVHFDNLNSVGGLLVIINLISQVVVYLYLPNLPMAKDNGSNHEEMKEDEESVSHHLAFHW